LGVLKLHVTDAVTQKDRYTIYQDSYRAPIRHESLSIGLTSLPVLRGDP